MDKIYFSHLSATEAGLLETAINQENYIEAESLLNKYMHSYPNSIDLLECMIKVKYELKDYAAVINLCNNYEFQGDDIYVYLIKSYIHQKNFELAKVELEKPNRFTHDKSIKYYLEAYMYLNKGNPDFALNYIDQALAINKKDTYIDLKSSIYYSKSMEKIQYHNNEPIFTNEKDILDSINFIKKAMEIKPSKKYDQHLTFLENELKLVEGDFNIFDYFVIGMFTLVILFTGKFYILIPSILVLAIFTGLRTRPLFAIKCRKNGIPYVDKGVYSLSRVKKFYKERFTR